MATDFTFTEEERLAYMTFDKDFTLEQYMVLLRASGNHDSDLAEIAANSFDEVFARLRERFGNNWSITFKRANTYMENGKRMCPTHLLQLVVGNGFAGALVVYFNDEWRVVSADHITNEELEGYLPMNQVLN